MSLFNGFEEDRKFVLFLLNIDKKVDNVLRRSPHVVCKVGATHHVNTES